MPTTQCLGVLMGRSYSSTPGSAPNNTLLLESTSFPVFRHSVKISSEICSAKNHPEACLCPRRRNLNLAPDNHRNLPLSLKPRPTNPSRSVLMTYGAG